MHPLGPTTYGMIKAEQDYQLASLERRHRVTHPEHGAARPAGERAHVVAPTRRFAYAVATALLMAIVIAGAALGFSA